MATADQEAYVAPYHVRLYQWQPQFNFVYHVLKQNWKEFIIYNNEIGSIEPDF